MKLKKERKKKQQQQEAHPEALPSSKSFSIGYKVINLQHSILLNFLYRN